MQNQIMSAEEAKRALFLGEKITHSYFGTSEYVRQPFCQGIHYEFEDGVSISQQLFWEQRKGSEWQTGWGIFNS